MRYDALLANGDFDALLQALQRDAQLPGDHLLATTQIMRVHAIRGDKAMARQKLAEVLRLSGLHDRALAQQALESMLCCCEKNADGYLKSVGDTPSFEAAFLRSHFDQAAGLVKADDPQAIAYHGLLYLQAMRSGAKDQAEASWSALLADLQKGGREQRLFGELLAGRKPLEGHAAQRVPLEPDSKRVLLAVLAQRYPDRAKDFLSLARRLDFQHDAISLCLRSFLQQP
jgi:hypothetical protein